MTVDPSTAPQAAEEKIQQPAVAARDRPLAGVGVLVTRPAEQADRLVALIEAAGGHAIRFPTVAIAPPADPQALHAVLGRLAEFDLAIFISPNAAEQAFKQLAQRGQRPPPTLAVGAVGAGTAAALEAHGIEALTPPERFDSEGLLALPALADVAGRRIVIFRGDGGRALLGDTLRARGATVAYAECYRRVRPTVDVGALRERWVRGDIDVVTITSVAAVENLHDMLSHPDARARLLATPVAVLHRAQAPACARLGFVHEPIVARQATDAALVDAIGAWAARGGR